ncbi:MAG: hypothetical protein AAF242_20335, partial [Bacteroidota bacterium]
MKNLLFTLTAILLLSWSCTPPASPEASTEDHSYFMVSFPGEEGEVLDGRLMLMLSSKEEGEPRFQISDGPSTQQLFGLDVEGWKAGENMTFRSGAYGYPITEIKDFPKGKYQVQVLFHKYETFNRADGHTVKLPMDRGEGQQWNRAPGNQYSSPQTWDFDPASAKILTVNLDQTIPAIEDPADTKYIKHIKIKSEMLSKFWGRDMYLGAHVLLPEGFDENPNVKYPLAIMHG